MQYKSLIDYEDERFPGLKEMWENDPPLYPKNEVKKDSEYNGIADDYEDMAYMDFQEANYEEYFDWAKTYRYCIY